MPQLLVESEELNFKFRVETTVYNLNEKMIFSLIVCLSRASVNDACV